MDTKLLDKLFSPSCWSKRFATPEQVESEHVAFAKIESERIRKTIRFETVQYGDTFTNETFDIYGIDLPKDAPIFIYIHGGYWQILDKTVSAYGVEPLVNSGIKVIVLDYELCPNVSLEQLVDQVQRAAAFIVKYATTLGSRGVHIAGHSAGAHLVMCMLNHLVQSADSCMGIVKSAFLISGVFDLSELRFTTTANANNILQLSDDNYRKLSPVFFVFEPWTRSLNHMPVYFYVGDSDAPKLIEQSHEMYSVLKQHRCNSHLHVLETYDHFNIVEQLAHSDFVITQTIISEANLNLKM